MKQTPTGIPIRDCPSCGYPHPVTRNHCQTCGKAHLVTCDRKGKDNAKPMPPDLLDLLAQQTT